MSESKTALVWVAGLIVVAGAIAGIWRLGWYVDQRNIQHRYENNVNSQQYQAGIIQRTRDYANDYRISNDPGQKRLIAARFCAETQQLNPVPPDLATDITVMCAAPAVGN